MIELNSKTQQDFLNREWVQKLLDAGVDMSDAKYCIYRSNGTDYIDYCGKITDIKHTQIKSINIVPTYTVSELLYKLNEWPFLFEMEEVGAPLSFCKDAPFYSFYYAFKDKNGNGVCTIEPFSEYPIEAAAELLLQCVKNNIPYDKDISGKE